MTNENKKSKNLVSSADDDPTAELEVLVHALEQHDADDELEADANTFDCVSDNAQADVATVDVAFLRREIRLRDQNIDQLQFDMEQLRARWNGLDAEIKVRERLTDNANAELQKVRDELDESQRMLQGRQNEVDALAGKISLQEKAAADAVALAENLRNAAMEREQYICKLEEQAEHAQENISDFKSKLADTVPVAEHKDLLQQQRQGAEKLEELLRLSESSGALLATRDQQLAEANTEIKELGDRVEELLRLTESSSAQLVSKDQKLAQASAAIKEESAKVQDLTRLLADKDTLVTRKSAELDDMRQQRDKSQSSIVQIRRELTALSGANDVTRESSDDEPALAKEITGLLVDSRQQIRELQSSVSRTEAYADSLRLKLQDQVKATSDALRRLDQTETSLAGADSRIDELTELLESEKLMSASLQEKMEDLKHEFENEIRKVRFELGSAQQTIADNESINEELTSDLIDHQTFRQALEAQLERTEESNAKLIRSLRQKVRRLEHQHDEDQHKISNKDGAIAALLSELASRSSQSDSAGDIGMPDLGVGEPALAPPIHDRQEDRTVAVDRVTRLLIGNIDGQELRFPLFKDRLTIGRTSHNDIQLKAQYISRRHALIVTEHERTRIVDWGSTNGIAVNNKKVTEHTLRTGDIVTIGTAEFRYEERAKR